MLTVAFFPLQSTAVKLIEQLLEALTKSKSVPTAANAGTPPVEDVTTVESSTLIGGLFGRGSLVSAIGE